MNSNNKLLTGLTLTDENFEKEIQNAEKPVLVDFWASYCSPCFILSPILEKLAGEFQEKIIFTKANLDTVPMVAQKFGIDKIPTVILFQNGKPISGFIGLRPEPLIREWLENILGENKNSPIGEGKLEKAIREYEEYAKKNNLSLNLNRGVVERIIKGLLENEKKYGVRYCPCKRITGNLEEDRPKICPCQFMRKEIEEHGHCLCELFVK